MTLFFPQMQHLCREGHFELGAHLAKEASVRGFEDMMRPYEEMHRVLLVSEGNAHVYIVRRKFLTPSMAPCSTPLAGTEEEKRHACTSLGGAKQVEAWVREAC